MGLIDAQFAHQEIIATYGILIGTLVSSSPYRRSTNYHSQYSLQESVLLARTFSSLFGGKLITSHARSDHGHRRLNL